MSPEPEPTAAVDDVVRAVGDRIHAGRVSPTVGYQAIGAVAAWRAGFHEIALAEMDPGLVAAVEAELAAAGIPVPWRGGDPQA